MSKIYIAALVGLITVLAPLFGIHITDNEALNSAITGIVDGVIFILITVFRVNMGDIHFSGVRK